MHLPFTKQAKKVIQSVVPFSTSEKRECINTFWSNVCAKAHDCKNSKTRSKMHKTLQAHLAAMDKERDHGATLRSFSPSSVTSLPQPQATTASTSVTMIENASKVPVGQYYDSFGAALRERQLQGFAIHEQKKMERHQKRVASREKMTVQVPDADRFTVPLQALEVYYSQLAPFREEGEQVETYAPVYRNYKNGSSSSNPTMDDQDFAFMMNKLSSSVNALAADLKEFHKFPFELREAALEYISASTQRTIGESLKLVSPTSFPSPAMDPITEHSAPSGMNSYIENKARQEMDDEEDIFYDMDEPSSSAPRPLRVMNAEPRQSFLIASEYIPPPSESTSPIAEKFMRPENRHNSFTMPEPNMLERKIYQIEKHHGRPPSRQALHNAQCRLKHLQQSREAKRRTRRKRNYHKQSLAWLNYQAALLRNDVYEKRLQHANFHHYQASDYNNFYYHVGPHQGGGIIGDGISGKISVVAKRSSSPRLYAVKHLRVNHYKMGYQNKGKQSILNEFKVMNKAKHHPNLITFAGVFYHNHVVTIMMNKMKCDGYDLLRAYNGPVLQPIVRYIIKQVVRGLAYLHDTIGYSHGDIKPENILFDPQGQVKLIDFGFVARCGVIRKTAFGTVDYMAPEVFQERNSNESSDIWSLGMTLFELLNGRLPRLIPRERFYSKSVVFRMSCTGQLAFSNVTLDIVLHYVLYGCLSLETKDPLLVNFTHILKS